MSGSCVYCLERLVFESKFKISLGSALGVFISLVDVKYLKLVLFGLLETRFQFLHFRLVFLFFR